ncbi:hypothetical protein [Bradyrhizobium sp. USDA 3458]|uniref:hypothetical protein n=1 Tax=Bradyrhizobium sp. USDA 3458 TaxID=2591461 RepID=UPI001141BE94|nr:hypothetical protein [Bradyrhizobium sp. USDA 3458]
MVVACKRLGDETHFVIRQPDATLTLLPAWMAAPVAASFQLIADPRLPVDRLLEVRVLVDAVLASSSRESSHSRGGGHGRRITSSGGSFREPSNNSSIPIDAHQQMLELLKELLAEALTDSAAETHDGEDSGEQDHA